MIHRIGHKKIKIRPVRNLDSGQDSDENIFKKKLNT